MATTNQALPDLSGYNEAGLLELEKKIQSERDSRKFCKTCKQALPRAAKTHADGSLSMPAWNVQEIPFINVHQIPFINGDPWYWGR